MNATRSAPSRLSGAIHPPSRPPRPACGNRSSVNQVDLRIRHIILIRRSRIEQDVYSLPADFDECDDEAGRADDGEGEQLLHVGAGGVD